MKKNIMKLVTLGFIFAFTFGFTGCGNSVSVPAGEEEIMIEIGGDSFPLTATLTEFQVLAADYGWTLDDTFKTEFDFENESFETAFISQGNVYTEDGQFRIGFTANEDYTDAAISYVYLDPQSLDEKNANILGVTTSTSIKNVDKKFTKTSGDEYSNSYKITENVNMTLRYNPELKSNRIDINREIQHSRIDLVKLMQNTYPELTVGEEISYPLLSNIETNYAFDDYVSIAISDDWEVWEPTYGVKAYRYNDGTLSENESSVVLFFSTPIINLGKGFSEVEFADYVKDKYQFLYNTSGLTKQTATKVTPINIGEYYGYIMDIDSGKENTHDTTQVYLYVHGTIYNAYFSYSNSLDPAIKEKGIQSALDVMGTLQFTNS